MQLIYQGKTNRCHPQFLLTNGFNVTQSINHWSNEEKAKDILLKVIIPYVQKTRKSLKLHNEKKWLLIVDVFKDQWSDGSKKIIKENDGKVVPVPANMAHIFQ